MSELVRERIVDAPPSAVFKLLSHPDTVGQWMGSDVEWPTMATGDLRVVMAGRFPAAGEVIEMVPGEKIVFSWGWEMPNSKVPPCSSTVEITLQPRGAQTLVRLHHRDLPDDTAWDYYLCRLAAVAAGDDPGPDTGPGDEHFV